VGAARRKRFRRRRCAPRRRWRESGGHRRRRQHCPDRDPRRQASGETSATVTVTPSSLPTVIHTDTDLDLDLDSLRRRTRRSPCCPVGHRDVLIDEPDDSQSRRPPTPSSSSCSVVVGAVCGAVVNLVDVESLGAWAHGNGRQARGGRVGC